MNRIELLRGFLHDDPKDSFSRYALALEYVKVGQTDDAQREFETLLGGDPAYLATYYQLGQLYHRLGRNQEAQETFRSGIRVAVKQGDAHTQSELESILESIS